MRSPFLAGPMASRNTSTGEMRGMVTDQTQSVMSSVTVSLLNRLTQIRSETVAESTGIYDLYLPEKEYSITLGKAGFKPLVRSGIMVHVGGVPGVLPNREVPLVSLDTQGMLPNAS